MLDVVGTYQFSSAACNEAIEVLDILKIAFDDDDIENLKNFVKVNLSTLKKTHFTFKSGNRTTNSNLATIIKIGIALKRLTTNGSTNGALEEGNDETEDIFNNEIEKNADDSQEQSTSKSFKHLYDNHWSTFCNGRLRFFETKWTKKLEGYTEEDRKQLSIENEFSNDGEEEIHDNSLDKLDTEKNKLRNSMIIPKHEMIEISGIDSASKDDWEINS